jgi:hypothetical protein
MTLSKLGLRIIGIPIPVYFLLNLESNDFGKPFVKPKFDYVSS